VILGVVMPLLVYSAAAQFSFVRFVRDLQSILTLGVGLVLATTGCVGLVTAWLVPGWGLATAFVLAAVVSPPDTVTAVTHGAEIGLPRRVTSVLGGETLVNDATALTVFALAVAAATRSRAFIASPVLLFGYETAAGIATGLLLGAAAVWARTRLREARLEAVIGLLVPFAAYWAAEQARASGVLAVVMAGFSVSVNTSFAGRAHRSPDTYRTRLTEAALWPVIDTLLEAFVFAAMGLQLHAVLTGIPAGDRPTTITVSAAVLGTVIAVRFAWVLVTFGRRRLSGTLEQRAHAASPRLQALAGPGHPGRGELLGWPEMILVSWTGG
jgi:monovalent cation/hydrogen antiporter